MAFRPQNGIDLGNQRITNVGSPAAATDAVPKNYVDNALQGLSWKQPVRVATTTNGALSTAYAAGQTIDGYTLATGDRILLKDQSTGSENGIYTVNASGAPTRATDADTGSELQNATAYVVQGTVNADRAYTQTANDPTLGTTALVFAQVGGGTSYSAGNGLALSGTTFSVAPKTGGGIVVDGTGVAVDPSVVARKYATNLAAASAGATQTVTHNLGTLDVDVTVMEVSSGQDVVPDVARTSANTVTVLFAAAISAGQYRVVVMG